MAYPDGTPTARDRAWSRQVEQNEAWDGEREIAAAAKRRFAQEWRENGPTTVTVMGLRDRSQVVHTFPTRRAAEQYADTLPNDVFAYVRAVR